MATLSENVRVRIVPSAKGDIVNGEKQNADGVYYRSEILTGRLVELFSSRWFKSETSCRTHLANTFRLLGVNMDKVPDVVSAPVKRKYASRK